MGLWSTACQRGGLLSKYCCRNGLTGSRFSLYRVAAGATPRSKDGAAATKRGHAGGKAAASSDGSPDRRRSGGSYQHQHRGGNKPLKKGTASSDLTRLSFEDFAADSEKPVGLRGSVTTPVTYTTVDDRNCEVVFGVSPCLLALTSGRREAFRLLVKEGDVSHRTSVIKVCEEAHRRGVQIKRVSKKHLDRISAGRVHQGVCLQASPLSYLTEETACAESVKRSGLIPLWLVLDGVQDPMNLGAILRSAYFLGVDRVAAGLHNSCPLTPVVSKASSGAMEVIDVYGYESLEKMLKSKVSQGWHVVGTVGAQAEDHSTVVTRCTDFQMTKPTLLLMGGEGEGVSRKLLPQCQTFLTIPPSRRLIPGIESLNVSVATGILLHSLLAHRAHQSGS